MNRLAIVSVLTILSIKTIADLRIANQLKEQNEILKKKSKIMEDFVDYFACIFDGATVEDK